jgi:hypothetical protein
MPAANCATPPKSPANGNRYWPELALPNQPARLAATMNVAAEKPKSPRIEGAAIGWRKTRVCRTQSSCVATAPLAP